MSMSLGERSEFEALAARVAKLEAGNKKAVESASKVAVKAKAKAK